MMSISSQAGRRLAKAKAAVVEARKRFDVSETQGDYYAIKSAQMDLARASDVVADELIAQGFHDMDGED